MPLLLRSPGLSVHEGLHLLQSHLAVLVVIHGLENSHGPPETPAVKFPRRRRPSARTSCGTSSEGPSRHPSCRRPSCRGPSCLRTSYHLAPYRLGRSHRL